MKRNLMTTALPLRTVSLFSGIGGFECGLEAAGHKVILMSECDPYAQAVLKQKFRQVPIIDDVRAITKLPNCDLLTAGWPCQDISIAGKTSGLMGKNSGLISEVFRLIETANNKPKFVLLENVAFALDLRGGEVVRYVTEKFESLGYHWAYRILDTRMFGLPQRRRRLFILAERDQSPADLLFDGIEKRSMAEAADPKMVGFYWTEGNRGLGWSPEAIPPLKVGSSLSIPSPPAIWNTETATFHAPGINDAERLQGFPTDWTSGAEALLKGSRKRWSLVGNAVSVPVATWLGRQLAKRNLGIGHANWTEATYGDKLPKAAYGGPNSKSVGIISYHEGPNDSRIVSLSDFGLIQPKLISLRAILGFTRRFELAPLRPRPDFLTDLRCYARSLTPA